MNNTLSAAYCQACNHFSNFSKRILHCMIDATLHSHKLSTHVCETCDIRIGSCFVFIHRIRKPGSNAN
ncbi:hypothetical protein ACFX1Q_047026 [Malus domestica]